MCSEQGGATNQLQLPSNLNSGVAELEFHPMETTLRDYKQVSHLLHLYTCI